MKKYKKLFSYILASVLTFSLFSSIALADSAIIDYCTKGQDPEKDFCIQNDYNLNYNRNIIIRDTITGGLVIIILAVSAIIFIKTREKHHK